MRKFWAMALVLSGCGAACCDTLNPARDYEARDPRTRIYILPMRAVWETNVVQSATLLDPTRGQVCEGRFGSSRGMKLVNAGSLSGLLLDFGRELHGGIQLGLSPRGGGPVRLHVRFGESVSEAMSELGEKNAGNDHVMRDYSLEVPAFGTIETGNTGFRFVWLGLEEKGEVGLEFVRAVSLMRPMKRVGGFKCSDERLNRVFETAVRTVHLCCQDYLWDGIKRDRLVWAGDLHPETLTVLSVFGAADVIPQTLDYIAATTPADAWANGFPTYTLCWIRNLAAWYRFTGDQSYLARYAEYLPAVFSHLKTVLPDGVWRKEGGFGAFLDWPTHHNSAAELAGAQALSVMAMEDLSELLSIVGRPAPAAEAKCLLAKMRSMRPDPCGTKSAAALLALSGLKTPGDMFKTVLSHQGHSGVSTFYGYYMIEAMSAAGENQRAMDTVRDYWGGMLDMGATSFWEDFNLAWTNGCFRIDELPVAGKKDIHGDFGDFCYKGFRHSLCHGWSAGPADWCIRHVLGIRALDVGCKTVEVRPNLCDLAWAEGALALPNGRAVHVRAEKGENGTVDVQIDAPADVRIVR